MSLIVAVDEEWGIGKDGGLLAHLPEGVKYSRETTRERTVVMERRTLESFPRGKPLKNRVNMILSRDGAYVPEDVRMYHSMENVLEVLRGCREENVFITGGDTIYREFLPCCNKAYVIYIYRAFDVDTAFKNLDQDENWKLESVSDGKEHEGVSFGFKVYRRVR